MSAIGGEGGRARTDGLEDALGVVHGQAIALEQAPQVGHLREQARPHHPVHAPVQPRVQHRPIAIDPKQQRVVSTLVRVCRVRVRVRVRVCACVRVCVCVS